MATDLRKVLSLVTNVRPGCRRVELLDFLERRVVQQSKIGGLFDAAHRAAGCVTP